MVLIPTSDHYWLRNAHVPLCLLTPLLTVEGSIDVPAVDSLPNQSADGLARLDLEIKNGVINQIVPSGDTSSELDKSIPAVDLRLGMVWCCFVDLHTHLDKGHIWPRTANLDGTFASALEQTATDYQYWQCSDVYRRMEFGIKCSYAHGTKAIRTHIDAFGQQAEISLDAFTALRRDWKNRLMLQAAPLVSIDYYLTPAGEKLADQIAEIGGVLGGLPLMNPDLDQQLNQVFTLAKERNLDLDFHTDESGNPNDMALRYIAQAALRHEFSGQIVCGHCCSLAVQPLADVMQTMTLVKQAGIGIVSLPMCNLYLQDRNQSASQQFMQASSGEQLAYLAQFKTRTPRWRGVTLVHELKQLDIPVAFASDNCRDPFYAYGDHDGWEVFTQAVRIAQLDAPLSNWCQSVTTVPADLMQLPTCGRIGVGLPADLILFSARYWSELLARPQHDRIVLRDGKPIDATLPDYAELDDLWPL